MRLQPPAAALRPHSVPGAAGGRPTAADLRHADTTTWRSSSTWPTRASKAPKPSRVRLASPTTRIVLNAVEIEFHEVTIGIGAAAQKAVVALDEPTQTATLTVPKPLPPGRPRSTSATPAS